LSITADYFLLYHGVCIAQTPLDISVINDNKELFLQNSALLLCANRKNFDRFIKLSSFQSIIHHHCNFQVENLQDMHYLQSLLIATIDSIDLQDRFIKMGQIFQYLFAEEIITYEEFGKLSTLFDDKRAKLYAQRSKTSIAVGSETQEDYLAQKKKLLDLIEQLKEISHEQNADNILRYLSTQKFSIGITGIINSGKSTMLNAMLGAQVLGTSTIPETANLSIIEFGKQEEARVLFWSEHEWAQIESGSSMGLIGDFVKQTRAHFGDTLSIYIQKNSKEITIPLSELPLYTSAQKSDKKCNLVKAVKIQSSLELLQDGLQIVDTPGLDDPVIQREEITKEYLANCDMLVHLMNAKQCATNKDIEFIIDALLYQNITQIAIIITRVDGLSKQELDEVIEYTKSSITNTLQSMQKDAQIQNILDALVFFPISAKAALHFRTNEVQVAKDMGYEDIEQTGVVAFEKYMKRLLFGKDSAKSTLIIQSAKKQIAALIDEMLHHNELKLSLMQKSQEQIDKELANKHQKIANERVKVEHFSHSVETIKADIKDFEEILDYYLTSSIASLCEVVQRRIIDDVHYNLTHKKPKPTYDRINTIAQTAINDGVIDIIREYRYKLLQKAHNSIELIIQKQRELAIDDLQIIPIDIKEELKGSFEKGYLTKNHQLLYQLINERIRKCDLKSIEPCAQDLLLLIKNQMESTQNHILEKTKTIHNELDAKLSILIDRPIAKLHEQNNNALSMMRKQKEQTTLDEVSKSQMILQLNSQIEDLHSLKGVL
jgi:GTP-binding protein EngB required for normal cell division